MFRQTNNIRQQSGFSLLEAMIATAIVGIGFVGVFTLATMSEITLRHSVIKQKLQMQADQILGIIEDDIANIDSYNLALTTCTSPQQTNTYLVRQYEWCQRLAGEVGAAGAADTRSVTVTTLADGRKVVTVVLGGENGNVQIIMKRIYLPA